MAVALLKEPPLSPYTDLGPYRRKDYETLPDDRSRVLPEIHLNLPAFWKEVEDRLGSR